MYYINSVPTENGNYGNPQSNPYEGAFALPEELLMDYIATKGFAVLTVQEADEEGEVPTVTAITPNAEALAAYAADHPEVITDPLEEAKAAKIAEMSAACREAITAGIDVDGAHYSMQVEDQLNMMSLLSMVQNGAETVPYHADGEECRFYSAEEFSGVADAATQHKLYQESYFNSLRDYINALETVEDVEAVTYGAEIPVEYRSEVLRGMLAEA